MKCDTNACVCGARDTFAIVYLAVATTLVFSSLAAGLVALRRAASLPHDGSPSCPPSPPSLKPAFIWFDVAPHATSSAYLNAVFHVKSSAVFLHTVDSLLYTTQGFHGNYTCPIVSAVAVNLRQPRLFDAYGRLSGFVMSHAAVRACMRCSWAIDGGTLNRICPKDAAANCSFGCTNTVNGGHDAPQVQAREYATTGAGPYSPDDLGLMLETKASDASMRNWTLPYHWNEVVLDRSCLASMDKFGVDAIFAPADDDNVDLTSSLKRSFPTFPVVTYVYGSLPFVDNGSHAV